MQRLAEGDAHNALERLGKKPREVSGGRTGGLGLHSRVRQAVRLSRRPEARIAAMRQRQSP
jgi:hypothetical protein